MSLTPGARLGHFEIVSSLGAGGMGEVHRARDTRLGRDVAIKVLPPDVASDPERLGRFESEARAAAALRYPKILAIHDVGNIDGVAFMVAELVEGKTCANCSRNRRSTSRASSTSQARSPRALWPLTRAASSIAI